MKKRARIDEIASNLQSKISQNKQQEDAVINVEDDEEEEEDNEVEIEVELDREEEQTEPMIEVSSSYAPQQMWGREANDSQKETNFRREFPMATNYWRQRELARMPPQTLIIFP